MEFLNHTERTHEIFVTEGSEKTETNSFLSKVTKFFEVTKILTNIEYEKLLG